MRKLALPVHDDASTYRRVAVRLNYETYENVEPYVLERFADFKEAFREKRVLQEVGHPLDLQLTMLSAFYDVATKEIESYKDALRRHNGFGCPYCGEYCSTPDLDHYLPRSKYGELSLYSHNLIPSCSTCNRKLGTLVGPDLAIYPYGDTFLSEQLFMSRISWVSGVPVFKLLLSDRLDRKAYTRLQAHCTRLEIEKRFIYFAASSVPRYRRMALATKALPSLRRAILAERDTYLPNPGINAWPVILSDLLTSDDAILEWLLQTANNERVNIAVRGT